ncbi:hypothetical protein ACF1BS_04120 [Streptomyces sp. NPDC014748]|uniref:hypothetical protein n=1 Tax=Streptomyces sp. NPDC014748 TaxID=3364905 RepID=UPI0036FC4003
MRLRDAKERVEREHPELTGSAKLEKIKELRAQAAREPKSAASGSARCARCDQQVKPVQKKGWLVLAWLTVCQLGAVIAAVVNVVRSFAPGDASVGGVGWLIVWPAAVHPAWLGLVAAAAVFLAVAALTGAAGGRAERAATCPLCGRPLAGAESSQAS